MLDHDLQKQQQTSTATFWYDHPSIHCATVVASVC